MKYYAVTEDPNELMHYGILGMKWGVRHDKPRHAGSRRRSPAYKKAQSKLGKMMKSGIKKAEASWKAYNSPQAKYNRQTNRAIEKARKGKLKYGKLTDDQVRRVTERLNLERQARELSDKEKTFMRRLGQSVSQGIITGVGQGFGNIAAEKISRRSKLKTKRMEKAIDEKYDREKEQRRIENGRIEAEEKFRREFEQQRSRDKYEHERDRRYLEERTQNAYRYGVSYDSNGNLDSGDYKKLYAATHKDEANRDAARNRREQERATAKIRKEQERAARQTEIARKKSYQETARRIERQQREEERKQRQHEIAEEARRKAAEHNAYWARLSSGSSASTYSPPDNRRRRPGR